MARASRRRAGASARSLATLIKNFRPELDIYLITDRSVEALAAAEEAAAIRRIFFDVEEALEIHLSIMDGVNDRYRTPYFSNLLNYSQRPIGTFHALPIARGKSVFHSKWIRDMGQFYGTNIFLAESSATTGGLDSLLEPTGNIKAMQELAARAFGAQRCYLATNGTSTSNKIVVRLSARPATSSSSTATATSRTITASCCRARSRIYVEAFPLTEYSMYGAVPLRTIKKALLDLQGGGQARPRQARRPDELHVRRPHVQHPPRDGRVPGDQAGPDLPVGRGVVRLCPVLAAPPPTLGHGRRQGACATKYRSPAYRQEYEAHVATIEGLEPNDPKLLDMRLLPDPDKVRIRAYQTNSTHKSMSAFRQGSMIAIWDEDFAKVEGTFQEAFLTHTSTSPNLQLIASLDVARRQMELEGYELTMRMTGLAIELRSRINSHPLISKYFRVATAEEMIPAEFRESGLKDYGPPHSTWRDVVSAWDEDEFALDPTRLTLLCGEAGFDGTAVQGPPRRALRHPDQQDVAQQRPRPDQHQQHPWRRGAPHQGAGGPLPRDRRPPRPRRQRGAGGALLRASSLSRWTCRTSPTSATSTTRSATMPRAAPAKGICARRSSRPTTRRAANT